MPGMRTSRTTQPTMSVLTASRNSPAELYVSTFRPTDSTNQRRLLRIAASSSTTYTVCCAATVDPAFLKPDPRGITVTRPIVRRVGSPCSPPPTVSRRRSFQIRDHPKKRGSPYKQVPLGQIQASVARRFRVFVNPSRSSRESVAEEAAVRAAASKRTAASSETADRRFPTVRHACFGPSRAVPHAGCDPVDLTRVLTS